MSDDPREGFLAFVEQLYPENLPMTPMPDAASRDLDTITLEMTREQAHHLYLLAQAHYWQTAANSSMSNEAREIFMNRSKDVLLKINERLTEGGKR